MQLDVSDDRHTSKVDSKTASVSGLKHNDCIRNNKAVSDDNILDCTSLCSKMCGK